MEPKWNPSGTHLEPQVRLGKDSIGKVSIGKVSLDKDSLDKEIECADGTNEPCGSLVSPEGDIAADAASSASAEQSNKVDFSFSSASAEQPTQNSYSAPSAAPKYPKKPQTKPRYGNFDPEEAFRLALARSGFEYE